MSVRARGERNTGTGERGEQEDDMDSTNSK